MGGGAENHPPVLLGSRGELISVVSFKALRFKLLQCIFENSLQRDNMKTIRIIDV